MYVIIDTTLVWVLFWHCHPSFTLQFYADVFILVLLPLFFLTILDMVIILHRYINFVNHVVVLPPELV